MNRFIVSLLLVVGLLGGVGSCSAMSSFFDTGLVVTTEDQVAEGGEYEIVPVEELPIELKGAFPGVKEGENVVLVGSENLVEGATFLPASTVLPEEGNEGLIKAGLGIASAFIPGIAAWEGVLTLFSRRKRKHYVKAMKSVAPTDGNVDLVGAISSILTALGAEHSSKASEAAFEGEETASLA